MNMKVIAQSFKVSFFSLFVLGGWFSHAMAQEAPTDIYSSPFDACFENGYNVDTVSQIQAFDTAQCFASLLVNGESDPMVLGASAHTIREYSMSWYRAAADKGHPLALSHLTKHLIALNDLEQQLHSQVTDAEWQMMASDETFRNLDANKDGMLSVAEASASSDLQQSFSQSDFDRDGLLSIGEYTVTHGEATAAGQP